MDLKWNILLSIKFYCHSFYTFEVIKKEEEEEEGGGGGGGSGDRSPFLAALEDVA